MDAVVPSVAVSVVAPWTRKCESPRILICEFALFIAHPYQRRRGIGHDSESSFALPKHRLGSSFPYSLLQQSNDQQRLNENYCPGSDDVVPVTLPEGGLTVHDHTARWQSRFQDLPAAKLSPVHAHLVACSVFHWDVIGPFSREYAPCDFRGQRDLCFFPVGVNATDAPVVQTGHRKNTIRRQAVPDPSQDVIG